KVTEEGEAATPAAAEGDKPAADAKPDVALPTIAKEEEGAAPAGANWRDAGEEDFTHSGVQEGLYRDLTKRREDLEKREKALTTREALLEAAEREFDQKLRELSAVRAQIESLMAQQTEEEKARTASLVKIYEGMKAKDAARIFNTLETEVLLRVLTAMSERKSSPIIAEMDPERARNITILMAQQTALPQLPAP
ncbi:MAG TPA: flagellar protein FlbB, partial [Micavibrio sp.]